MPSISQKAPIPLPINGVLKGVNPRLIGPAGLIESKNWIYRDGKFRVRDGMVPLGEGDFVLEGVSNLIPYRDSEYIDPAELDTYEDDIVNLMPETIFAAWLTTSEIDLDPNGDSYTKIWINFSRWDGTPTDPPDPQPIYAGFINGPPDFIIPGGPPVYMGPTMNSIIPPHVLGSYWWDYSVGFFYTGALQRSSTETWLTGDPAFLGAVNGVDEYTAFAIGFDEDHAPMTMMSPVIEVPIQGGEYEFRLKVACDTTGSGTIFLKPWSAKYIGVSPHYIKEVVDSNGWTHTQEYLAKRSGGTEEYPNSHDWGYPIEHTGQMVSASPGWDDNTELVTTLDLSDFADHTHVWFEVVMYPNTFVEDFKFAIGNAQITSGTGNAFRLPSASNTAPGAGFAKTLQRPMGLTQFDTDQDSSTTVMGTTGSWWVMNTDLTWTKLSDGSADHPDLTAADNYAQVVFEVFDTSDPTEQTGADKFLLGCNGIDPVMYWDGDTDYYSIVKNTHPDSLVDDEPVEQIRAKTMAMTFDRFMYGNIKIGNTPALPDAVVYTYQLTYNKWKATNIVRLADTPGPITAMQEMGNQLTVIYKTDAIYVAQAQGGQLPFGFQLKAAHVTGPASPLSVVSIDEGLHVYLAEDGDLVLFDGVRPRSLTPTAHNLIQAHLNFEMIRQTFGMYNRAMKELYFIYPPQGGGDNSAGIMINLTDPNNPTIWPMSWKVPISAGGFTYINQSILINELEGRISELQGTIDSFGSFNPALLFCSPTDIDGNIDGMAYMSKGFSDYHGAIPAYFKTGLYDFGEIGRYKTIKEIDHLFSADAGESVTVGLMTSDFGQPDGDIDQDVLDLNEGPFISSHRMTGRLFSLSIETEASGRIEWLGSEAAVEPRGLR